MIEFADPTMADHLAEHGVDAVTLEKIIAEAEASSSKLYLPNGEAFLTKSELESGIVYVKYTLQQNGVPKVLLVYSTKARFAK